MTTLSLRLMTTKKSVEKKSVLEAETAPVSSSPKAQRKREKKVAAENRDAEIGRSWCTLKLIATVLAFIVRFWRLGRPDSVVFDEVHFGKFASHYLQREYYFDLHPPLAKLMFAAVGWLAGYDGRFKFDTIGESYTTNKVPYVAYRSLPAFMGSMTVPIVFSILENSGFGPWTCFFGACLVLFDNAQITQTRLILLDAALSFFIVVTLYAYVKFRQQRHAPFGVKWWTWLLATGLGLSSVISTKYVGLFSFLTIGAAVIADLWQLLDTRDKAAQDILSLKTVFKHFIARLWALIVIPFLVFLFWFYVHFAILANSGPGDSFMSPEFQATLGANPVAKDALDLHFFDTVRIQSQNAQAFLHSHLHHYPMQYPDGRISSQGQQVTGYPKEDPNNLWQILPPVYMEPEEYTGNTIIIGSQNIMLRHVATDTFLMTHDVASPGYNTNEEFTTTTRDLAYGAKHDFTLFNLDLASGGDIARTKLSMFRLKHVQTMVSMWLSDKYLPDWGYGQLEINGNKKLEAPGTLWSFAGVEGLTEEERKERHTIGNGEVAPRRSFWVDYLELQSAMFRSNNALTATHPYMSAPWSWPILENGISFWSNAESTSQIFLIGNFVGWYLEIVAVLMFVMLYIFDWLAILRDFDWIAPRARAKLHNTMLWYFLGWAFHYLPFFLMGRQLFLHHYLPAQIIAALLTAGLVDFVTGAVNYPRSKLASDKMTRNVCLVLIFAVVACFVFFAPLSYGLSITPDAVKRRQWNKIQLHFNK